MTFKAVEYTLVLNMRGAVPTRFHQHGVKAFAAHQAEILTPNIDG